MVTGVSCDHYWSVMTNGRSDNVPKRVKCWKTIFWEFYYATLILPLKSHCGWNQIWSNAIICPYLWCAKRPPRTNHPSKILCYLKKWQKWVNLWWQESFREVFFTLPICATFSHGSSTPLFFHESTPTFSLKPTNALDRKWLKANHTNLSNLKLGHCNSAYFTGSTIFACRSILTSLKRNGTASLGEKSLPMYL